MSHQLFIVSSDQRIPSQLVYFEKEWKGSDLKQHLSKVFPGEPPVESQRLVFAGQLITDDSKLLTVIGKDSISRTVHLVLPPSFIKKINVSKPIPDVSVKQMEQNDFSELQQQYLKYLQNYYASNIQPVGTNIAGYNGEIPMMFWPYMQMAQAPLNVADVQQQVAQIGEEEQPRNRLQRWLAAFGGNNAAEEQAAAPDAGNNDAGGFDIVDFVYAVFRFFLIASLCFVYSSWQRIALVALVAAYFYWRNGDRRNPQLPLVQQPAVEPVENADNSQQSSSSQSDTLTEEVTSSETGTTTAEEATRVPEIATTEGEQVVVVETSITKIADVIKTVTLTSFRLVVAIFSSLVPELPMDLANGA